MITTFSIGGFSLSEDRDRNDLLRKECDLLVDGTIVGLVYITKEDGILHVDLTNSKLFTSELTKAITKLRAIAEYRCPFTTRIMSETSSKILIVEMLMEFRSVVQGYNALAPSDNNPNYYVVGLKGQSLFSETSPRLRAVETLAYYTELTSYDEAVNYTKLLGSQNIEESPIFALALLTGVFDWHLAYEDYLAFNRPFA